MKRARVIVIGLAMLASVWMVAASCSGTTVPAEAAGSPADTVAVGQVNATASDPEAAPVLTMRNVQFRFTKDLVVGIERIRAQMKPSVTAGIVTFDDPASFALDVSGASIRLTLAQAQVLMNTRVFNYPGVNVHNLRLEADGQELVIHGSLTKGATIPFTMVGTLSLRGGRWLVVDAKEIKIGAVGVTGLLSAIHVSLQSMINTPASGQVRVEKNTMLIDVLSVLPPPHIHGVIAAIDCCTRGVGLELGGSREVSDSALRVIVESATQSPNFIAIRGGRLRFGKLIMTDSDLDLIDADSADPFDFFLRDYQCQLAAGDAHTTLQFGWRVRMPDYAKLSARQCPAGARSG